MGHIHLISSLIEWDNDAVIDDLASQIPLNIQNLFENEGEKNFVCFYK